MSFENELGVVPPTGFWDPLGLSKDIDATTFAQRRTAELKHGRVAMLAVLGYLVQDVARLPGTIDLDGTSFSSIPNGIAALSAVPAFGWFQIGVLVGWWEIFGWQQQEGGRIGDFGFYNGKQLGEKETTDLGNKEINNGRAAMIGIAELIVHDLAKPDSASLFDLKFF